MTRDGYQLLEPRDIPANPTKIFGGSLAVILLIGITGFIIPYFAGEWLLYQADQLIQTQLLLVEEFGLVDDEINPLRNGE